MSDQKFWHQGISEVVKRIVAKQGDNKLESIKPCSSHGASRSFLEPAINIKQSPEHRAIREIQRIVAWYGWPGELTRALDTVGVESLFDLPLDALEELKERMLQLEDAVQHACDSPDAPPAR